MSRGLRTLVEWPARHPGRCLLVLASVAGSVWIALNVGMLGEVPPAYFSQEVHRVIEIEYALGLLWWCLFAATLWLVGGEERAHLLVGWTAKFLVMLVVMLFYEYKYRQNLDAFRYLNTVLTGEYFMYRGVDWFQESWIPTFQKTVEVGGMSEGLVQSAGTENTLRILLIISRITGPSYHALKVVFGFIGFVGIWFVYRGLVVILGRPYLPALYGMMLYPSILFWSSIVGKDPLFLCLIGLYVYGGALWLVRGSSGGLAWMALAGTASFMLRPWMAAIEAGPIAAATFVRAFGLRPLLVVVGLVLPALLLFPGLGDALKVVEAGALVEELATRVEGVARESSSGSDANVDFSEAQAMLQSPFGIVIILFSGLFRPLPFDVANVMVAIAALENTILLAMAVVAYRHLTLPKLEHPLLVWAFTYSLLWSFVYGLVVLANFGAGVRYKLQVLPFLLLSIFLLLNREGRTLLDCARGRPAPSVPEVSGRCA